MTKVILPSAPLTIRIPAIVVLDITFSVSIIRTTLNLQTIDTRVPTQGAVLLGVGGLFQAAGGAANFNFILMRTTGSVDQVGMEVGVNSPVTASWSEVVEKIVPVVNGSVDYRVDWSTNPLGSVGRIRMILFGWEQRLVQIVG